jgi:hypothetical protein
VKVDIRWKLMVRKIENREVQRIFGSELEIAAAPRRAPLKPGTPWNSGSPNSLGRTASDHFPTAIYTFLRSLKSVEIVEMTAIEHHVLLIVVLCFSKL